VISQHHRSWAFRAIGNEFALLQRDHTAEIDQKQPKNCLPGKFYVFVLIE